MGSVRGLQPGVGAARLTPGIRRAGLVHAPDSDRSVVDLACGTGFYSRLFKRRGATEVCGIDVSGEMVDVARRIEGADPLGGRRYDIATAVNLLNYSETVDAMTAMCRTIHAAVRPGGRP